MNENMQLLDLPPHWLGSMTLSDPDIAREVKQLFRTCSNFQQLIFKQAAVRPVLSVRARDTEKPGQPVQALGLAMAEAAGINLHLKLEGTCVLPAVVGLLLNCASVFQRAQQPQQPVPVFTMSCITAVSLIGQDTPVSTLLPDVLVQCCPNLQELHLVHARIADQYTPPTLTCTSLKKLKVDKAVGRLTSPGLRLHVLNLPSLTALHFGNPTWNTDCDYDTGELFWAAISRYSSQLQSLCCRWCRGDLQFAWRLPWSLNTHLPVLRRLELARDLRGDEQLQQLLRSAPNVTHLSLNSITGLTQSFAHLPCTWQQLSLREVYVAGLPMLPLASCTRLELRGTLFLRGKPTPEQITAGVAAAQAAGGLHFLDEGNHLALDADDVERLTAASPLLQRLNGKVMLFGYSADGNRDPTWQETRALLAVLGQHLRCRQLGVWAGDDWDNYPGAIAQLPELLPHVQGYCVSQPADDAQLVELVRAARRPFTLHYTCTRRLRRQLQQAMKEAGHQLVTIVDADDADEFYDLNGPDSDDEDEDHVDDD